MTSSFNIYLVQDNGNKKYIGRMPRSAISFNRYNEGLLVAAGKISNTQVQESAFLKFSAQFRDKAFLEFRSCDVTYTGDFCFINFDPETNIVVFGSLGAVREHRPQFEGPVVLPLQETATAQGLMPAMVM